MTYSFERFLIRTKQYTEESILLKDVGYETVELYKEEIDERYFTKEEWLQLPQVCMVTAISFINELKDEYMMLDVYDEENSQHFKSIWIKNGDTIM
ncbi:hypothetical protein [Lysinibacillus fusiformis]|uniref:hypothetical protein n=1 Tax=Lysinibacillus fusiformis TaxID=28031 RepID=UPI0018E6528C|nr:hypothetical protein [Lysinibacillus fusiformis]MBI6862472.1 hypothetical protein [Lysinibacillus fusiformis]